MSAIDVAMVVLALVVIGALTWVRFTFVSLNRDLRRLLAQQQEIKGRLTDLETLAAANVIRARDREGD